MANNLLYAYDGQLGTVRPGTITPLVQGQSGQDLPIEVRNLADQVIDLSGYTITGHRQRGDSATSAVYALDGDLTLSGDPDAAPQFTWTPSENDTALSGTFKLWFLFTSGDTVLKTDPVSLRIVADPDVNASVPPSYVGVTAAARTLLNSLLTIQGFANFNGSGAASAIKVNLSASTAPTTGDDTGDGYTVGSLWLDTTNDKAYICLDTTLGAAVWLEITGVTHAALSTTAHGGILPEDAGIVTVSSGRDLASTDAGKILECNGTFTLTCPNGLDAGFQCALVNVGSGTITIAATTTLQSKDSAVTMTSQYGMATVYHRGSNVWLLAGDIA